MGKTPGEVEKARKRDRKAEREKPQQKRVYRTSPATFERVSPERFASAEKHILTLLGKNVREARHRASLTQADVADIIHTTQPFVGSVERGERNIRLSTVVRLAYAVRTDPGALLLGERAAQYSMETLLRLVAALHAHLEATMGEQVLKLPAGGLLTVISSPSFQFNIADPSGEANSRARPSKKSLDSQ
jgi:transcriptional regulator with XRE-family HTH domain